MSRKEPPQTFSHRYRILHHLGEGSTGRVYKAYDRWIGKDVALKVLAASQPDSSLLQEFKNEFSLLAELRHPGVVEVLDFGYSEDPSQSHKSLPYFTMEFVEGKSLPESFSNLFDPTWAPAEFERLYHLIWQVCDILEYLHLRALVHCDLKPDNIKVTEQTFRPKILDFGLSQDIGSKGDKKAKGTLPYMAPEVFEEEPLDERTDLYSLGIILYELVARKLPFWSRDPVRIVSAHLQENPAPPSKLNPHLPASFSELILKLLEKSPSCRPCSATRVKEIIETALRLDSSKSNPQDFSPDNTAFFHLYSGPLIGRERESGQLEAYLKRATSSRGSFLILSGEQGVGKTSLLKNLKMKCQLQDVIFVESHCLESQTVAYQPLVDVLRKLEPYVENRCADPVIAHVKDIFGWSGSETSNLPEAQASFHQGLTDLLVEISQSFPFVMVLENLQWADSPTLRFLEHFRGLKDKGRILLCCSLRDDVVPKVALDELVDPLPKQEDLKHLRLERFGLAGTRKLIRSKLIKANFPSAFFAYVQERTSGNPFFVIEVLKYLLEKNIVALRNSVWTVDIERQKKAAVPDSIEAVLLKNLERYDQKTIDFLNVLAVIGKKITLRLLKDLHLFDQGTVLDMLSQLSQDQLLVKQEQSGGHKTYFEFANQSLQNLLYHRLDEAKRIGLHRKVGELMEQLNSGEGESVFDIAFHYLTGNEFEKAYGYALMSAEKMKQRFAKDEALRYLQNAIEVASKLGQPKQATEKKVRALRERADFCRRAGELNQAESDYLSLLKLIENTSDLKLLAETHNRLGEIYRLKHDYKKAIFNLQRAMQIHDELDDPLLLAHTLSYLGLAYWTDSQYQNALDSFQKALEIDRRLGNKLYMATTSNNMGLVLWSQHQYSKALRHFTDSLSLYRELNDKEWIARSLNNIGATYFQLGEYQECVNHFLQSFKINEEMKNEKEMAFNLENLSQAFRKTGDYSAALSYGKMGLELASELDFPERMGRISKDLGATHFDLGHYQEAYEYLRQAKQIAERIEDKELQVLVRIDLSTFFMLLNDERRSNRLLKEAAPTIDAIGDEKSQIGAYQIKSRFEAKAKRFGQALKLLDKAFAMAEKLNVGEESLSLCLDSAKVHLDRGDVKKSNEYLNRAKDLRLERHVLLQPTFHLISGRAKFANGDSKSAENELKTALKLAERLEHEETLWQIHHHLGKVCLADRDFERAYRELRKAATILKELSERIKDEELKRKYLKDTSKREMLSDLREVAKQLVGETKLA